LTNFPKITNYSTINKLILLHFLCCMLSTWCHQIYKS